MAQSPTGGAGTIHGGEKGRLLAEYRRRRPLALAPRRWRRSRVPDRTAKYGVRDLQGMLSDEKLREVAAHPQLKMFEIKLSQGAKPGKGGILPGGKVTAEIAKIRGIPQGEDSISPNRHPEIIRCLTSWT